MKNIMNVALGIASSVGGFLDVGAIATAALAGAAFGVQMLWVLALGTLCVIFLTEMAGRLACVSHHSLVDAVRERCGFRDVRVDAGVFRAHRRVVPIPTLRRGASLVTGA